MRSDYRPLVISAIAVLVSGLAVGLALAGVSDGAVLAGVAVLAGLMVLLFLLSRRDGTHGGVHDVDEYDEEHRSTRR